MRLGFLFFCPTPLPPDPTPVFAPYAETPVAAYRYDALGRRVQTVDSPSFQAPDKRPAKRWVPGDANPNGTLAQAPALTGGTFTLMVFARQNDVAKLDAQGKPVLETAYGNPQGYDTPTAYFRLEKSLVWVAKNGKETVLSDGGDLSDADGRPEGLLRLAARFGKGGRLVTRESWKTYSYHLDRLGSVIAVSDAQGKILEQYRYDPYGKPYVLASAFVIPAFASASSRGAFGDEGSRRIAAAYVWKPLFKPGLGNSKLFTGRDYDSATKTYWYRARTYSPTLGRFLQRDPLGYADGANPYAYVGNGPWGATDPSGKIKSVLTIVVNTMNSNRASASEVRDSSLNGLSDVALYGPAVTAAMHFGAYAAANSSDLSTSKNFFVYKNARKFGKSDFKHNSELKKYASNRETCSVVDDENGCYIDVQYEGNTSKVYFADLGNIAVMYDALSVGLSYEYTKAFLLGVSKETAVKNGQPKAAAISNEKEDEFFYEIARNLYVTDGNALVDRLLEELMPVVSILGR